MVDQTLGSFRVFPDQIISSVHLNQNKMKLSLINQMLNVDNHILAISPSKLIIFGFYEVMKCYFETPPPFHVFHHL